MKKLISLLLCLCMTFTLLGVGVVHAEANTEETKAITVLSDLGILEGFEDGSLRPDELITRAQMTKIICRALGYEHTGGVAAKFSDVPENHWAADSIGTAYTLGIINGVGDGSFAPDAPVKYQDAVVMIMRALGYDRIAKRAENGGYPTGYLKLASQYGVLKNVSFDNMKDAPRGIVAKLVYNSLTTPLVDVSYYGASVEDDRYIIFNGKNGTELRTLLTFTNEIHKVEKATITATPKSDSSCIDKNGNYLIQLNNDKKVYVGDTKAADMLGAVVDAYMIEDEDLNDWKLVSIVSDGKSVISETVSDNLSTATYSNGVYSYYANDEDRKPTELDIDTNGLMIYYNGRNIDIPVDLENMLQNADKLEFTGFKNADYDKIFITKYDYKIVKSVNTVEKLIKFDSIGTLDLDPESRGNEDFIYTLYGASDLGDIVEGDVLNILCPLGETLDSADYLDIYVSNNTVSGKIEEKRTTGEFIINGKEYETVLNNLSIGDEGIFYLSIDGKIVKKTATTSVARNFGLITAIEPDSSFGTTSYTLRMFTSDNKFVDYPVAETVRYYDNQGNMTVYKTKNNGQDMLFAAGGDMYTAIQSKTSFDEAHNALKDRFVSYKTNANGALVELRLGGGSLETIAAVSKNAKYNSDFNEFGGEDIDNATLFVTPIVNDNGVYNIDKDKLDIIAFNSLDEEDTYAAHIYMIDEEMVSVILSTQPAKAYATAPVAIVKAVGRALDKEDNEVDSLTIVQSGETKVLKVDYKYDNYSSLSVGDVFQYMVNTDNEIIDVEKIYDASTKTLVSTYVLENDDVEFKFGNITKLDNYIELNEAIKYKFANVEGVTYAQYDIATDNVKPISINGLRETVRNTTVYGAIIKLNEYEKVEDVIMIIFDNPNQNWIID